MPIRTTRTTSVTALAAALLAAGALLTGCSSGGGDKAGDAQPVAEQKAAVGLGSAEQVAAYLEQSIQTMSTKTVYTAATDPDHLLGTAGGYKSKIAFTDSRVQPGDVDSSAGSNTSAVDYGGVVETYGSQAEARARGTRLLGTLKGLEAAEYHYFVGSSLIRVSRVLTPDQALDYQTAAAALG